MKTLFLSMLVSACSWSRAEVARQTAFGILMAADAHQTQEITERCNELNPLIGKCGEGMPVVPYFFATMFIHTLIIAALPKKYRAAAQWFSLGVQGSTVLRNALL